MSESKNFGQKNTGQKKKSKKRKEISPLFTINTQHGGNTDKTGFTDPTQASYSIHDTDSLNNTCYTGESGYKRSQTASPQFFDFNQGCFEMNYSQPPFNNQFIQSPPGFTAQYAATQPSNQPPTWATSIIDDIKSIKQSVAKIDNVEKTVNKINAKLIDLENKVSDIDKRVSEVETASSYISSKFESNAVELKTAKDQIKTLKSSCSNLSTKFDLLEKSKENMNSKISDLEFRSMKDNLIFYGVPENNTSPNENCELIVKDIIKNHLEISPEHIIVERAHRMGSKTAGRTRPIVIKFNSYKDRENIRTTAYAKKEDLKNHNLGIGIQLPKEWRDARKALYPIMQREKQKGNEVRLTADKLYINGSLYTPSSTTD